MNTNHLFSILLISTFFSCSTSRFNIDPNNKDPFPKRPHYSVATYKTTGVIERIDSKEGNVKEEVLATKRVEDIAEKITLIKTSVGDDFLQVKVDCNSRSIIDKRGFEEALLSLEKRAISETEKDAYISKLVSVVERALDVCDNAVGPFNLSNFVGKDPGFIWYEDIPIEGFQSKKMKCQFLGWHTIGKNKFAVLRGIVDAKVQVEDESYTFERFLNLINHYLVSSDWKTVHINVSAILRESHPETSKSLERKTNMMLISEKIE